MRLINKTVGNIDKYTWRILFVSIHKIYTRLYKLVFLYRSCFILLFFKSKVGKNLRVENNVYISPGCTITIGNDVFIGKRSELVIESNDKAEVIIGDNTWISHDFQLHASNPLIIGSDVLIGEFVSVRDTSHNYSGTNNTIRNQGDTPGKIIIEDDVWIGRGCLILGKTEPTILGKGSIIAANSTVSRSISPYTVWGGVPAKFIKNR